MTMDWEHYFVAQRELHNAAAVEAIIKALCYRLRGVHGSDWRSLHFLEVGCGAGSTLEFLARRGATVSGIDLAPTAVAMTQTRLAPYRDRMAQVECAPADALPFAADLFDGVIEANVLQHLPRAQRQAAYREIARVLRPGGFFVGYCLSRKHTVFGAKQAEQLPDDPGTIILQDARAPGCLPDIGLTHFFAADEFVGLLPFATECLPVMFTVPRAEAARRGFSQVYEDHFLVVQGTK